MAQKKQFTLEELNFGGNRYYQMTPTWRFYEWWGERLIRLDVENVSLVDKSDHTETPLFDYASFRDAMHGDTTIVGTNLLEARFPYADEHIAILHTPKERIAFDFEAKKVMWRQSRSGSLEWNAKSGIDAFLKEGNLFVRMLEGEERQLTTDGSREIVYGQSVHRDEFGITKGTFFSPDGRKLAFYRMDQSMVTDYPQVNTFTRIATHEPDKYPMAGTASHKVTVGIYDADKGTTTYLKAGDPTDRYFTNISWSPDGKRIYLIELNRRQNFASLDEYDAITGDKLRTVYTETDEKYVQPLHPIHFLPWDDSKFLLFSQREGFMRLYLYDISGKMLSMVTTDEHGEAFGNKEYVVKNIVGFCNRTKSVIVSANITSCTSTSLVSFGLKDGKADILGCSFGVAAGKMSESGLYVLNSFSNPDVPRAYQLINAETHKVSELFVADEPWKEYAVPHISTGEIIAADGKTNLKYREVLPPDFDSNRKYPAVVYVYGGPGIQLIEDSRNYAARPWEIYMAQKGYVVWVVDSRGSNNRGKEFEQVTYHQLGQIEMQDQMKGVKALLSRSYIDKDRLGVHGWSYGGYMTISLMLNYPDIFKVGVAGGPVIDWKWYEVMYGERYMGTPQDNEAGYKITSLLDKAKRLNGRLQIIIGMNDPVVVPQHALGFIHSCNEVGTQPDFYVYPGEEHNMRGHQSVHLHERITRYFEDYLK